MGSFIKKYNPGLSVVILEREVFPRDHVGESLLPLVGVYLDEMGVWDKIERANFPIKIGATYRWGLTPELWDFEFLPNGIFHPAARPAKYEGQRIKTAFQVDRSVYDKILLDHARGLGCVVREGTKVTEVNRVEGRVTSLQVKDRTDTEEQIEARYYVDCSAGSGILRRKMGVAVEYPTKLRNIAIWSYWQNARWAETVGVGGTRIQVLSLGYGWIWFIPISPNRTSIGLVIPADHFQSTGMKPNEIYSHALQEEPRVRQLLVDAVQEETLSTTNDWSYVASEFYGENWFLAGDSCGFADPILSAGLTLAHSSAREVAYIILELDRNKNLEPKNIDADWLKRGYQEIHERRIRQHIRFAEFWYRANSQFKDLIAYCSEIAKDSGLDLDPDQAFQWLGTGGFANDDIGQASVGAYTLPAVKRITQMFTGQRAGWKLNEINELRLELAGAKLEERPYFDEGRIHRSRALVKGKMVLPLMGPFSLAYDAVSTRKDLREIVAFLGSKVPQGRYRDLAFFATLTSLEAMLAEGWIKGKVNKKKPVGLSLPMELESESIHFKSEEVVSALTGALP